MRPMKLLHKVKESMGKGTLDNLDLWQTDYYLGEALEKADGLYALIKPTAEEDE